VHRVTKIKLRYVSLGKSTCVEDLGPAGERKKGKKREEDKKRSLSSDAAPA
jgi:hypothetical protein